MAGLVLLTTRQMGLLVTVVKIQYAPETLGATWPQPVFCPPSSKVWRGAGRTIVVMLQLANVNDVG